MIGLPLRTAVRSLLLARSTAAMAILMASNACA
jgi:hypothetical protein